jgi:hypothetical protein
LSDPVDRLRAALSRSYRLESDVAIKVLHPELGAVLGGEQANLWVVKRSPQGTPPP